MIRRRRLVQCVPGRVGDGRVGDQVQAQRAVPCDRVDRHGVGGTTSRKRHCRVRIDGTRRGEQEGLVEEPGHGFAEVHAEVDGGLLGGVGVVERDLEARGQGVDTHVVRARRAEVAHGVGVAVRIHGDRARGLGVGVGREGRAVAGAAAGETGEPPAHDRQVSDVEVRGRLAEGEVDHGAVVADVEARVHDVHAHRRVPGVDLDRVRARLAEVAGFVVVGCLVLDGDRALPVVVLRGREGHRVARAAAVERVKRAAHGHEVSDREVRGHLAELEGHERAVVRVVQRVIDDVDRHGRIQSIDVDLVRTGGSRVAVHVRVGRAHGHTARVVYTVGRREGHGEAVAVNRHEVRKRPVGRGQVGDVEVGHVLAELEGDVRAGRVVAQLGLDYVDGHGRVLGVDRGPGGDARVGQHGVAGRVRAE